MRDIGMLPHSEACERNRGPLLAVLGEAFATTREVLEIGSGTGQHAVYFARGLPHLRWRPSDRADAVQWIGRRLALDWPANVDAPIEIDVRERPWNARPDGIFSANTLHIMSWQEVTDFFAGAGETLTGPGTLCVYGPFRYHGEHTSQSNARFDESLRRSDPRMGVRDFEAVNELAAREGLDLVADVEMPANNRTLVWRRPGERAGP